MNFPLYVIRPFRDILHSSTGYKIIQTAKSKYVLDYEDGKYSELTYGNRRVKLLGEKLPYSLYPINFICHNVGDMVTSGKRRFIDNHGRILTWTPSKFYPVTCHKITSAWENSSGTYTVSTKDINQRFIVKDLGDAKYIQVINLGRTRQLYGVCETKQPTIKRKF